MLVRFKGAPTGIILTCVRWYVAYPLSIGMSKNDGGAQGVRGPRADRPLGPEV